jgi:hypothetical protein
MRVINRFSGVTGPQATYQDSAAAWQATQRMLNQMRSEGYTDVYRRGIPMDRSYINASYYAGDATSMNDHLRRMRGEFTPEERALYEKYADEFRADGISAGLKGDIYDFFGARDRVQRGGMVYSSPVTPHASKAMVPHDPRIMPEEQVILKNPETGAIMAVPLNPEPSSPPPNVVNTLRVEPVSRRIPPPLEPLPMREAGPIPSEELDMNLRPMRVIRSTGRKPQRMMRSNPNMRTGQEPNYDVIWDEKRKQWTTRPIEPEELDYYRRENLRVSPNLSDPPVMSF